MPPRLDRERLHAAWTLLQQWVDRDEVPAVAAAVGQSSGAIRTFFAGRQRPEEPAALMSDAIFLIASPTKPLTALAVMMLAERGELLLTDPVARYVPEFAQQGKQGITLWHCLTHTSGLVDMLPENRGLRERHAPLSEFADHVCRRAADFPAGHGVQYQSMGLLMLGEVVRRVSGQSLPEFLKGRVFDPLGMQDTALGMPDEWTTPRSAGEPSRRDRIAHLRVPPDSGGDDWGWNSDYWRRLGAPWGGLLSTAGDWARLCRHLLAIHQQSEGIVSPSTLAAMTTNQLVHLPDVPEANRRCTPWGLGWQLNWPGHARTFGDLLSGSAYGHWGATGTMIWIDPARNLFCVVLTTEPLEDQHRRQARFSNAVCAAMR